MPDNILEEGMPPVETDMAAVTPITHRHDRIVGNELRCSMHDGRCPVIFIKPTEVLEYNEKGELTLVDKAR